MGNFGGAEGCASMCTVQSTVLCRFRLRWRIKQGTIIDVHTRALDYKVMGGAPGNMEGQRGTLPPLPLA